MRKSITNDDVAGTLEVVKILRRRYNTPTNDYLPVSDWAYRQAGALADAIASVGQLFVLDDHERPLRPVAQQAELVLCAALHERLQELRVTGEWTCAGDCDGGVRVTVAE